jgi:hypothetical protein
VSTTTEGSAPEQPTRRRRRRRKPKLSVGASIGIASGVVSLVGGIVTLFFLFLPGCQPKAQLDEGTGSISAVGVERGVTFGDYLRRRHLDRGTITRRFLARRGVLVRYHYEARGFKHKALPLESQLIDDTHDGKLVLTNSGSRITPDTNNETRDDWLWSEVPRTTDTYHLEVTLYQPGGGSAIGTFSTDKFAGLAG